LASKRVSSFGVEKRRKTRDCPLFVTRKTAREHCFGSLKKAVKFIRRVDSSFLDLAKGRTCEKISPETTLRVTVPAVFKPFVWAFSQGAGISKGREMLTLPLKQLETVENPFPRRRPRAPFRDAS
jgi:hypothetical protein